jgi:hypothetical protein
MRRCVARASRSSDDGLTPVTGVYRETGRNWRVRRANGHRTTDIAAIVDVDRRALGRIRVRAVRGGRARLVAETIARRRAIRRTAGRRRRAKAVRVEIPARWTGRPAPAGQATTAGRVPAGIRDGGPSCSTGSGRRRAAAATDCGRAVGLTARTSAHHNNRRAARKRHAESKHERLPSLQPTPAAEIAA